LTSNILFDKQIWSSLEFGEQSTINFIDKYEEEFSKLNKHSGQLLVENFKIDTSFKRLDKSIDGYIIHRNNNDNKWIIKINILFYFIIYLFSFKGRFL
jgi:hypothetical protein